MREIIQRFAVEGEFVSCERYGNGHINDTYKVVSTARPYLLQRINRTVFKNPEVVQANILRVTRHLSSKGIASLTVVPTRTGEAFHKDASGNHWRVYLFITGASTTDVMETPDQARKVGSAFAAFQNQLADLPPPRLVETIPDFHHGPRRYEAFRQALSTDAFNRASGIASEIAFLEARENLYGRLIRKKLPERITHNDTKLNNVMLDDVTGEGVCVIDLDTVMPGLALYDFGDMCRSGTASAREDEKDLSQVFCRMDMFKALAEGYLSQAAFLTKPEREELVFSARFITQVIATRFLTDYLSGDVYFRIRYPEQNLNRFRMQMRMIQSMEAQADEMERIVRSFGE